MAKKQKLRIRPTEIVQKGSLIRPSQINEKPEKVSFNFCRLHSKQDKFQFEHREARYFLKLIERLKAVCDFTKQEILSNRSDSLRCHPIDFVNTSECGFSSNNDLDAEAYQFGISQHEHGRVHGYFVRNVFYVVWLDPDHELYSGK